MGSDIFTVPVNGKDFITEAPAERGHTLPTLYTKGRDGSIRQWTVSSHGPRIIVQHGVLGGKLTTATRTAKPKNVGRSNETTAEQQARLEAQAEHKKKVEREKYAATPEAAHDVVRLPMLAGKFKSLKGRMARVQRKLNGFRCRATWEDGKVVLYSRKGIVWDKVPHINAAVAAILPPGDEFDGELYIHGVPLQTLSSAIKTPENPYNAKMQYHVYDAPIVGGREDLTWEQREEAIFDYIFAHVANGLSTIQWALSYNANTDAMVKELHDRFVQEGYEGAIVRFLDGVYEWGQRSPSLLKVKAFDDTEFEITGFKEGEGIEEGLVLWMCVTVDGNHFNVRPKGTHEIRRWLFKHGNDYLGEKLTVRHFGWTEDKLPFHPVGEAIRLPEDLS